LIGNSRYPGFLPFSEDVDDQIGGITGDFKAGDNRVNEMPGLAVMHQVFHREHNRLARGLKEIMPTWGDERIYQEARRLVGALIQVVTYQEFLPIVLGEAAMTQFGLKIDTPSQYSVQVDPSIENQFATASYRFGHTLVSGQVYLIDDGAELGSYLVRDNYFNSTEILQSEGAGYKWILGGLTLKESQEFDSHFTEDLTNHLLRNPINLYGSDLAARNIQRGRDHGTPSYNEWRKHCGLTELTSWGAKPAEIETQQWASLSRVYAQPQDIDLYTGGLIETPISQTVTGPTLNCLLAPQFAKLKFGDRFFATHLNEAGSFTPEEMIELRGRTLGDILCQNSDITEIQENPFLPVSPANGLLSCEDSSRNFDLELFFQFKK
jgi:peroxidase